MIKNIITEIIENQLMWKKSLIASLIIAVILFLMRDRFFSEFWIALLTALNFLILFCVPYIGVFKAINTKEGKLMAIVFLFSLFLVNYFCLTTISSLN